MLDDDEEDLDVTPLTWSLLGFCALIVLVFAITWYYLSHF